jgi:hypothetical protein
MSRISLIEQTLASISRSLEALSLRDSERKQAKNENSLNPETQPFERYPLHAPTGPTTSTLLGVGMNRGTPIDLTQDSLNLQVQFVPPKSMEMHEDAFDDVVREVDRMEACEAGIERMRNLLLRANLSCFPETQSESSESRTTID